MSNEEANNNNNIMRNQRKSFLISHKKDLMNLCKTIGGTKGELFSYLINNMVFTDSTVKITYKKLSKKTGISYASVAKAMKEFEDNGLIKKKNGYLMIVPTLLMRGDYQSENRLISQFREFNGDIVPKQPKRIEPEPIVDAESKILILNSDSTKGRKKINDDYYSKESDAFWDIIFKVLEVEDPKNYEDRLTLLKKNNLALWDVMYIVQTVDQHKIKMQKKYSNFAQFFEENKKIRIVVCNGEEAYRLMKKVKSDEKTRDFYLHKLPSSAPSRGKYLKTYEEKLEEWKIIKRLLTINVIDK